MPTKKTAPKKETIRPPTKKEVSDAAKLLKKKRSPAGGRVMADKSVAVKQKAVKPKPKSKKKP